MDASVDLIDWLGEDLSLALGGLVIGALFGFFAQRSASACVRLSSRSRAPKQVPSCRSGCSRSRRR
ncbi:hypothetical protein [Thauera humireducens]|uniref:hypothetical protein n=1 Tax=Thauera humireducens TaxID=1134435 RepID=UPI0031204213